MKKRNPYIAVIIINIIAILLMVVGGFSKMLDFDFTASLIFLIFAFIDCVMLGVNIEKALAESHFIRFVDMMEKQKIEIIKLNENETPFNELNVEVENDKEI